MPWYAEKMLVEGFLYEKMEKKEFLAKEEGDAVFASPLHYEKENLGRFYKLTCLSFVMIL